MKGAHIWRRRSCACCGWSVVFAICTDAMATTEPYSGWEWWVYCSNKACENHAGEGYFQVDPDWVKTEQGISDR